MILLTARGDEADRIVGLELGADDYVTKPFSPRELAVRVRNVLRRADVAPDETRTAQFGDVAIDASSREVERGGERLRLTMREFDLLVVLARQPGRVCTHGALLEQVWGSGADGSTTSLRVHVTQLRKKLGEGPDRPRLLTEPGVGHRMVAGPDEG